MPLTRVFVVTPFRVFRKALACLGILAALASGCADSGERIQPPRIYDGPSEAFVWGREIKLEESGDVLNVWPLVRVDPRGGFLVADSREGQVRRYAADGRLLWHFGTPGSGPSEFRMPTVAVRLLTGEFIGVELNNKVAIIDSLGRELVRTFSTTLGHVQDADIVNDSLVLFAGLDGDDFSPRLHVFNLKRDTITASFFAPFRGLKDKGAARMANWSAAAIRGDTVAVVLAVTDTLHLYTTGGQLLRTLPIKNSGFRPPTPITPAARTNNRARAEWLSSFDLWSDVYWTASGNFIMTYQSRGPKSTVWTVVMLDRNGRAQKVVHNSPRLMSTSLSGDSLFFVSPTSEVPSLWAVATWR